ncbi:Ca-activated chloride channel family protein [Georgenia satyanarayanai]|uniref:Ca-activated chloride channel family protein n=1 Tax=Georgenia satyanarayanai TaxID=860221 RepID=A0A2Y9AL34_9MICO|nr:VWA domain-containing protein [Georgenia satyanarayanai]PYF99056.1 Ca-activated chloride channel family protein [Georgenia satyanarayanai]SSA44018.1 Ca-activated chloride channel family protein [Georgenia satyanarayanai]
MILRLVWPLWVIALVLLPLIVVCVLAAVRARRTEDGSFAAWLRRGGMVLALAAIALGPAVPSTTTTVATNVEMFFVVDRTGSMAAEDYDGGRPRLDGVRHDVEALVEAMPGARYSVITFDSQAARQLPLTTDARAVSTWAETLVQEITYYSAGSAVDRPLPALRGALEGAADRNPENVRLVFLLSDGENTRGDGTGDSETQSYAELAPLVDGGAVLGYGTAEGGQMRFYDGTETTGPGTDAPWILDETQPGSPAAVSQIDETQLRRVAEQLGVDYTHRTAPTDVSGLVAGIDAETIAAEDGRREVSVYEDVYWPAATVLAVLLAWEAWYLARRFPRPFASRRGGSAA